MEQDTIRWQCRQCGKPTLHTRPVYRFDHTPHILISLVCCCTWWIVWISLYLTHKRDGEWRCSQCGLAPDEWLPEDFARAEQAAAVQRVADRKEREAQEAAAGERRERRKAFLAAINASGASVRRAVLWYVSTLKRLSGGDWLVNGLLWAVTGLALLAWFGTVLYGAYSLWAWLGG